MTKELKALEEIRVSHLQAHAYSGNLGNFNVWFDDLYNTLTQALLRAKKVEELLELYREHHKLVPFTPGLGDNSKRVCDISIEITQLEKELKEIKNE